MKALARGPEVVRGQQGGDPHPGLPDVTLIFK
jgi:hypothetical protein